VVGHEVAAYLATVDRGNLAHGGGHVDACVAGVETEQMAIVDPAFEAGDGAAHVVVDAWRVAIAASIAAEAEALHPTGPAAAGIAPATGKFRSTVFVAADELNRGSHAGLLSAIVAGHERSAIGSEGTAAKVLGNALNRKRGTLDIKLSK